MAIIKIKNDKKLTTQKMMLEIFLLGILLVISSSLTYLIGNDLKELRITYFKRITLISFTSIMSCIIFDLIYYLPILFKKKNKIRISEYYNKVINSYSYVSGIIIALLLPVSFKIYFIPIICFVGVFINKLISGGINCNILNPAIIAVLFARFIFYSPLELDTLPSGIFHGSSLIEQLRPPESYYILSLGYKSSIKLSDLFLGLFTGPIGTTNNLFLFVFILYLILRGIIDYRISIIYLISILFSFYLLFEYEYNFYNSIINSLALIFSTQTLFMATFCLNDPITSPQDRLSKIIYALFASNLTILFTLYTNNSENLCFVILFSNILSYALNKIYKNNKKQMIQYGLIIIALIIFLILQPYIYLGSINYLKK